MKRVKLMLSGILVMAVVAGALAFKVKTPGVCAYSKTIQDNPPATTICNRIHASTVCTTLRTINGESTQYATTIPKQIEGVPCPDATAECSQFKTLAAED